MQGANKAVSYGRGGCSAAMEPPRLGVMLRLGGNDMKKWRVRDGIGREWEVTLDAVRRDFVQAIMQLDDLTKEQAEKEADDQMGDAGWDDYWFPEQMLVFRDIQLCGTMVKDISDDDKLSYLDHVAARNGCEIIEEPK